MTPIITELDDDTGEWEIATGGTTVDDLIRTIDGSLREAIVV